MQGVGVPCFLSALCVLVDVGLGGPKEPLRASEQSRMWDVVMWEPGRLCPPRCRSGCAFCRGRSSGDTRGLRSSPALLIPRRGTVPMETGEKLQTLGELL